MIEEVFELLNRNSIHSRIIVCAENVNFVYTRVCSIWKE